MLHLTEQDVRRVLTMTDAIEQPELAKAQRLGRSLSQDQAV